MGIFTKLVLDKQSSERVQRKMAELIKLTDDLRIPNRAVAYELDTWVQMNFRTEGRKAKPLVGWDKFKLRPDGRRGRWVGGRKQLRVLGFTLARWGRVGHLDEDAKLLQDTGHLRASFDTLVRKRSVTIGSDVKYAVYHEEGLPMRGLPQRRMLPRASDKNLDDTIFNIYDFYLKKAKARVDAMR